MNRLIVALGAVAMLVPSAAAFADSTTSAPAAVNVRTDDLDLTRADGKSRLTMRIADAAKEVCGDGFSRTHLLLVARTRACQAEVTAQVDAQVRTLEARRAGTVQVASVN